MTRKKQIKPKSERHEIADRFSDLICDLGLTKPFGGQIWHGRNMKGTLHYSVSFAMPAILDGSIEIYGPRFIKVRSQGPASQPTTIFNSEEEAVEFISINWGDEDMGLEPPVHPRYD